MWYLTYLDYDLSNVHIWNRVILMFGTIAIKAWKDCYMHTYLTAGMRNTCEQADAKTYKTLQTDLKPLGRWNTWEYLQEINYSDDQGATRKGVLGKWLFNPLTFDTKFKNCTPPKFTLLNQGWCAKNYKQNLHTKLILMRKNLSTIKRLAKKAPQS